jgi:hypothetical protein
VLLPLLQEANNRFKWGFSNSYDRAHDLFRQSGTGRHCRCISLFSAQRSTAGLDRRAKPPPTRYGPICWFLQRDRCHFDLIAERGIAQIGWRDSTWLNASQATVTPEPNLPLRCPAFLRINTLQTNTLSEVRSFTQDSSEVSAIIVSRSQPCASPREGNRKRYQNRAPKQHVDQGSEDTPIFLNRNSNHSNGGISRQEKNIEEKLQNLHGDAPVSSARPPWIDHASCRVGSILSEAI